MGGHSGADLGEMEGIASKLRNGGTQMENIPAPPPAPQVGPATQAVAGALALLASSAAGISTGMTVVGDAVQSGRDLYEETDQANADGLNQARPG